MASYNRIISLVPSLTELLIELGVSDQLIGRTRFCIHPESAVDKIDIIGGTKNPRVEKIKALEPDLIIANKEENREEDIVELRKACEVELTDIATIEDALITISQLADKLGRSKEGKQLIQTIMALLEQRPEKKPMTVAYLIWKDPWMTVGGDTYIHDVLKHYHLENVFGRGRRYPTTTLNELASRNPDLILLSSEPYPFKESDKKDLQEKCPASKIELVNGEWFSWYGSRMVPAFEHLNKWRDTI